MIPDPLTVQSRDAPLRQMKSGFLLQLAESGFKTGMILVSKEGADASRDHAEMARKPSRGACHPPGCVCVCVCDNYARIRITAVDESSLTANLR